MAGVNSHKDFRLPHVGTGTRLDKALRRASKCGFYYHPSQAVLVLFPTELYSNRGARTSLRRELLLHNHHSKSNHDHKALSTADTGFIT